MKIAKLSMCHFPMGASIVKSGRVLSIACNVLSTHPKQVEYNEYCISIHAELNAILLAQTDLTGATIYVARLNGNKNSKPCITCQEIIRRAGITKMVYFESEEIKVERIAR